MILLSIDPGTTNGAYAVFLDGILFMAGKFPEELEREHASGYRPNWKRLAKLIWLADMVVIEQQFRNRQVTDIQAGLTAIAGIMDIPVATVASLWWQRRFSLTGNKKTHVAKAVELTGRQVTDHNEADAILIGLDWMAQNADK